MSTTTGEKFAIGAGIVVVLGIAYLAFRPVQQPVVVQGGYNSNSSSPSATDLITAGIRGLVIGLGDNSRNDQRSQSSQSPSASTTNPWAGFNSNSLGQPYTNNGSFRTDPSYRS